MKYTFKEFYENDSSVKLTSDSVVTELESKLLLSHDPDEITQQNSKQLLLKSINSNRSIFEKNFSSNIDDAFISELSSSIGVPEKNESKEEFVERSMAVSRRLLRKKLGLNS